MSIENMLKGFWEREIRKRFRENTIDAKVELRTGQKVRYVNLDNAATTKAFKYVLERMETDLDEYGSVHRGAGQHSEATTRKYEQARETIGKFVSAPDNYYVLFTANTTDAINRAAAFWVQEGGKVLVSDIEHSSNLLPWLRANSIVQYGTDHQGRVNLHVLRDLLTLNPEIRLLTITASSNVTGYQPPIHEIAEIAHCHNCKIAVDACQYVQHHKIDMKDSHDPEHLDFIAFSGHKMYAPFGAGALIGPKEFFDDKEPYQIGGGNLPYLPNNQEVLRLKRVQTHDAGTPNAIGALALANAIHELEEIGMQNIQDYESALVSLAYEGMKRIDNLILYMPGPLGSVIPFDVRGWPAKLVAEVLAQDYGIATRAGSFCTYELIRKLKDVSPREDALIAEDIKREEVTANIPMIIRASFSIYNNIEDVTRLVTALREMSKRGMQYYLKSYTKNETTGEWTAS